MKVYIDLVFLINTFYDFLILLSVSILLKKHVKLKRILLGTLIGTTSVLILFIRIDNIYLLLYKIITSIVMVKVTFNDKNFFEELFYFYIVTIIIGGSQILISGSYYKINIIFLLIISPCIIYLYIKSMRKYELSISKLYQVLIVNKKSAFNLVGYMDTGNTLIDPITKLPVIIVNEKYKINDDKFYLVPVSTINNESILKCFKVDNIIIENKIINALVGFSDKSLFKNYDVILNENIREIISC